MFECHFLMTCRSTNYLAWESKILSAFRCFVFLPQFCTFLLIQEICWYSEAAASLYPLSFHDEEQERLKDLWIMLWGSLGKSLVLKFTLVLATRYCWCSSDTWEKDIISVTATLVGFVSLEKMPYSKWRRHPYIQLAWLIQLKQHLIKSKPESLIKY